jgi:hypothetical protein
MFSRAVLRNRPRPQAWSSPVKQSKHSRLCAAVKSRKYDIGAENIRIGVEIIGSSAIRSERFTNYDEMLIVTASDFW